MVEAGRPVDKNNVQPRVGFAYQWTDRTVIRGGTGLYFSQPLSTATTWMAYNFNNVVIQYTNDGRPNFAADPLNGQQLPSKAQAEDRFCHIRNVPGCLRLSLQELAVEEYDTHLGRSFQTSVGMARQIGSTIAVEADYVYSQGRNEQDVIDSTNLTFDPATGANYPFSDISRRAFPLFGLMSLQVRTGWSSYHAVQTSVTKRLSNRWQGSATYTLGGLWNAEGRPP